MYEDKQRLWMDELDELKQMYVAKLQQVTQQAQRSQRALQLQLYKAQQEKKRLQEELDLQQRQCEELRLRQQQQQSERLSPKLEETKWEVSGVGKWQCPNSILLLCDPGPWLLLGHTQSSLNVCPALFMNADCQLSSDEILEDDTFPLNSHS